MDPVSCRWQADDGVSGIRRGDLTMAGRWKRGLPKTDGSCVLPMAGRRRRIGYTSRRP